MKKLFYVYVLGKFCNSCYVKLARDKNEACLFFEKQGFKIVSIILA
jgi:hypothetical protein